MATTKDYCSINFTGLTHDHALNWAKEEHVADAANGSTESHEVGGDESSFCSAIPILKQHPMYDCLVLVRKYRKCLQGFALEFPIDKIREHERLPTNESAHHHNNGGDGQDDDDGLDEENMRDSAKVESSKNDLQARAVERSRCSQRRLVSRFLDGDDPMYRASQLAGPALTSSVSQGSMTTTTDTAAAAAHQVSGGGAQCGGQDGGCEQHTVDVRLLLMPQVDENGEPCQLVHVPINGLLDRLESYTRNGVAVDSRVYAFAMGLKTAERMMTTKSMKELHETPI